MQLNAYLTKACLQCFRSGIGGACQCVENWFKTYIYMLEKHNIQTYTYTYHTYIYEHNSKCKERHSSTRSIDIETLSARVPHHTHNTKIYLCSDVIWVSVCVYVMVANVLLVAWGGKRNIYVHSNIRYIIYICTYTITKWLNRASCAQANIYASVCHCHTHTKVKG